MPSVAAEYEPRRLAGESEQFWKARRLPPENGVFGPPDGPVLHQFEGGIVATEESSFVAYRAVAADVDARYLMLVGRRCDGTLRWSAPDTVSDEPPATRLLRKLAIWTGGSGVVPWDTRDRHAKVERLVGRLARRGVIVSRDLPLRFCPSCVAPRSPEGIIYQEELGDAHLVRFEIPLDGRTVNALVWVDAPWRLLGASALLVHPEAPYVVARYRRKEAEELVLTARSSLERFRDWIPGATFEVLEERPGREFAGRAYVYPLRHEFPMAGNLSPPGGTVLTATDVTGTGTGIVLLVPGHQSTDAVIADSLGITGWPLVTPKGLLDTSLVHKYAGLDLKTASEFVVRDLAESNAIFAELKVRRGVPHCSVCGTAMIWFPGRAWCLEPGRLPPEMIELYRRLLPGAPPLQSLEVAPWPVSETSPSSDPPAVALLECDQCERLGALDGPATCQCGGTMLATRRRLVPSAEDAFAAWARHDPLPTGDSVRLYVGERRRVPAVVHHLAGLAAIEGTTGAVAISLLPTLPEVDLGRLVETEGTDAVRAALVWTGSREGATSTFPERCSQERHRLARLWSVANELLAREDSEMLAAFLEPISGHLGELEMEDRALLARWERARVGAIADYDRGSIASVHRRIFRFLETDFTDYRRWTRDRLDVRAGTTPKRSALRTLSYVLRTAAVLLGPIVPYSADALFRRVTGGRRSLFETSIGVVERTLLDERLYGSWERWRSFLAAVAEFRRVHAIGPDIVIPRAVAVLGTDEEGDRLREGRAVLERLGRIARLELASPREPWSGRQRKLRPVESEIQRIYPTQASQIAHLLRRMPSRRSSEGTGAQELSVVIQGSPRRVLPSMVAFLETLPEGMVPSPWDLGELYLEIPGSGRAQRPTPPPLSPDAFWLVRHVERRLKRSRGVRDRPADALVVSASDPLASELRGVAEPLARYLEVSEVRVPETISEAPPAHRLRGRTSTGARWWVDIPGLPPPTPRSKGRLVRPPSRRVPAGRPSAADTAPEIDYSDEKVIAEEEAVRALNRELDSVLRTAVLGPSKVRAAWGRGFHDLGRYREASFDELSELPGFGRAAAEGLVLAFGGTSVQRPRPTVPTGSFGGGSSPAAVDPPEAAFSTANAVGSCPEVTSSTEEPPVPRAGLQGGTTAAVPTPPVPSTSASPATTPTEPPTTDLPGEDVAPGSSAEPIPGPLPPTLPYFARATERTAAAPVPEEALPIPPPAGTTPPTTSPTSSGPAPVAGEVGRAPSETEVRTLSETEVPAPVEPWPGEDADPPVPASSPVSSNPTRRDPEMRSAGERPTSVPSAPSFPAGVEEDRVPSPTAPALPGGEEGPKSSPFDTAPVVPLESTADTEPTAPSLTGVVPDGDPLPSDGSPELPALSECVTGDPAGTSVNGPPSGPSELDHAIERPGPTHCSDAPETLSPSEGAAPVEFPVAPPRPIEGDHLVDPPGVGEAAATPEEPTDGTTLEPLGSLGTVPGEPGDVREAASTAEASASTGPSVPPDPEPTVAADLSTGVPQESGPGPTGASVGSLSPTASSAPGFAPEPLEGGAEIEAEASRAEAPPGTGIPVLSDPEVVAPPVPEGPRGGIELMVGASVIASLQPFLEATAAGLKGICVVRESPERIRAHAGSRPVEIYWLTNMGRDRTLRPNDLPGFAAFLSRAVAEDHAQLVFIEGVEYLTHIHGVEAVLGRLAEFDRLAEEREVRVWLHVTPGLMRPGELERIIAAFPTAQ